MTKIYVVATDPNNPLKSVKKDKYGKQIITDASGKVLKVVTVTGPGKTDQSFKEMVSIKRLVADTERRGMLRATTKFEGEYDDFPAYDFQEAQFMMARAKSMFEAMPSGIRARFKNNPAAFMEFMNNPANTQEIINMGLGKAIDPPPPATPDPAPAPVPEPTATN